MFKKQDPYSYTQYVTLYLGDTTIGLLAVEYEVALYNDVLVVDPASVSQPKNQQFILTCTQRLFIKNPTNSSISPILVDSAEGESFENYPAQIMATMSIAEAVGLTLNLLDYSPQTVNTAVQQSVSGGASSSSSSGNSTSSTTGSSFSQSSSYGASVTVGDISGATASYEYTTAKTTENSKTTGSDSSRSTGTESTNSASMSIKDWGSYASVNPLYVYPTWVFGQEYPWNAIECRFSGTGSANPHNSNQLPMYISSSMSSNLYDGTFLYPPSELSMFGLNFVMKSSWRIYVDFEASTEITLHHVIDYYSASHSLSKNGDGSYSPKVYLDQFAATLKESSDSESQYTLATTLDLNIMGLDPIGVNGQSAIVGFIPSKFIPPAKASSSKPVTYTLPQGFLILATTNDLQVEDVTEYPSGITTSGFTASQASLTASWTDATNFSYSLMLYFKITDSVNDYTLYMKHWKTQATGVMLTIVVNGDDSTAITKYVDSLEAEGGDNNLLKIALRDLDFTSVDYHDYLQLGLNSIEITMKPIDDAWSNCGYQIRALSIERS